MSFAHLKDQTLLCFYENIRIQVEVESQLPHKFMTGESVRQYAAALRDELSRRGMQHNPIEWRSDR